MDVLHIHCEESLMLVEGGSEVQLNYFSIYLSGSWKEHMKELATTGRHIREKALSVSSPQRRTILA